MIDNLTKNKSDLQMDSARIASFYRNVASSESPISKTNE